MRKHIPPQQQDQSTSTPTPARRRRLHASLWLVALGAVVTLVCTGLAPARSAPSQASNPTARQVGQGGAHASPICGPVAQVAAQVGLPASAVPSPAQLLTLPRPASTPPASLGATQATYDPATQTLCVGSALALSPVLSPAGVSATPTPLPLTPTPSAGPGVSLPPAAGVPPVGLGGPPPASWVQDTLASIMQSAASGLADVFSGIVGWAQSFGFMLITPASLTYQNPVVIRLNTWLLSLMDGAVLLVLVVAAYQVLFLGRQGDLAELLPRLLLATLLGNFSLFFLGQFIELLNGLCLGAEGAFGAAGVQLFALPPPPVNWSAIGVFEAVTYLLDAGMLLLLSLQMAARLALLDLLAILLALVPLLYVLRLTRLWAGLAMRALVAVLVIQFLQVLCAGMGAALIGSFFGGSSLLPAGILNENANPIFLLLGAASLFLTFRLPDMLLFSVLRAVRQSGESLGQFSRVVLQTVGALLGRI